MALPGTEPPKPVVERLAAPTYQSLKDLHAYWLARKGDRSAPPRSAIRPEDFVRMLPHIALIDVIGDGPQYRFRVFGTGLVEAYGQELTGKFDHEVDLNSVGPEIIGQLTAVVVECQPNVVRIRFTKDGDGRYLQYERLALPLADDGTDVNMILLGYVVEKTS